MSLQRLVYVSRAEPGLSPIDIEAILSAAQTRNAEAGVSGLLLYDGANFLQYLEGAPEEVSDVFGLICEDGRHRDIVTLVDEGSDARCFESWSMGLLRVLRGGATRGGHGAENLNALSLSERLPACLPGDVRILIVTFACGAYEPSMAQRYG